MGKLFAYIGGVFPLNLIVKLILSVNFISLPSGSDVACLFAKRSAQSRTLIESAHTKETSVCLHLKLRLCA